MQRGDLVLAVLGVLLSVTMFVAQGPYNHVYQYVIGLSPLIVAVVGAVGVRTSRRFADLRNRLALATATRIDSSAVVRIENSAGDTTTEKHTRIHLISNAMRISVTPEASIFTPEEVPDLPPTPHVVSSLRPNRTLTSRFLSKTQVTVDGDRLTKYSWSYEISPALEGAGDYVDFTTSSFLPKNQAAAFRPEGDSFFWVRPSYDFEGEASMIAPAGYRIELLGAWVEEFDGTRVEVPPSSMPKLSHDGTALSWRLIWRTGARHTCTYRLKPFGAP